MISKIKESFLSLVRMGLWGESREDLSNFPLSHDEWVHVYEMSVSQTVEGIVYEGILLLPKINLPPYDVLLRWVSKIDGVERYNKKMRQNLALIVSGLSKRGISCVLLKGLGLAENYNNPLLRVSGDIDLHFPDQESYLQANELLSSKGIIIQKGDHKSVFYEFNAIPVEHHTKMIDIFNPFIQKNIKNLILREQSRNRYLTIDGVKISIPSYLLSQVQANAHILKHYIGFGVGLRQFCDVARLYFKKDQFFDGEELREFYNNIGLGKWMMYVHNFLVDVLGLDESKLPYSLDIKYNTHSFLEDILNSGNFGFHDVRFQKGLAKLSNRYYKRDYLVKRLVPHIAKLIKLSPNEVFWFPVNKIYTKIFNSIVNLDIKNKRLRTS